MVASTGLTNQSVLEEGCSKNTFLQLIISPYSQLNTSLLTQLYQKSQYMWREREQHALHTSFKMELLFLFTSACQGERGGFLQSSSGQCLQPATRPTLPSKVKRELNSGACFQKMKASYTPHINLN